MLQGGLCTTIFSKKIDYAQDSININLQFGFGRIQSSQNNGTWYVNERKIPILNLAAFMKMSKSLQHQLVSLFECGYNFLNDQEDCLFHDKLRNVIFSNRLNEHIGYPHLRSQFEYYHIVLSRNLILQKHIDHKNDHRDGYNHCIVY